MKMSQGDQMRDDMLQLDIKRKQRVEENARKVIRASDSLIKLAYELLDHPQYAQRNADYMETDLEHLRAAVDILLGDKS